MRKPSLLLALAASILMQTPASADDMADFAARYVTLKAAMDDGEDKPIKALLTKDYKATDMQGEVRDADEMITQLATMPVMSNMKNEIKVLAVAVTGAAATVTQQRSMTMQRQGPDGVMHTGEFITQSNDMWVNLGGKWLLQTTEAQEMTMKRDGVEVRRFKKGDPMPPRRGRPQ